MNKFRTDDFLCPVVSYKVKSPPIGVTQSSCIVPNLSNDCTAFYLDTKKASNKTIVTYEISAYGGTVI